MNDDLISRKSVLDYIEKEIATTKCTETISYLRALSVHINEYEPTAYDVDKVLEQLSCCEGSCNGRNAYKDCEEGCAGCINCKISDAYRIAIEIVKAGGLDDISISNKI